MKRFQKILVATDTQYEHHPIVDEAADIARSNGAQLKIVDVAPHFPWLTKLALKDADHVHALMVREKREQLAQLAAPLRDAGLLVETAVLEGKTSVAITDEAIRGEHDLVMRVAKGHSSRSKGFFGATGVRLLRKCPCAVWLVAPGHTTGFEHVLACVDTTSSDSLDKQLNDKVYELGSSICDYHGSRFSVIHVWEIWAEQMIRSKMAAGEFEELASSSEAQVAQLMGKFLEEHDSNMRRENAVILRGDPAEAIPQFAEQNGVDLVVMGTIARSGLSGMIMGNTAEMILNSLKCSVLALKPDNFVSPLRRES